MSRKIVTLCVNGSKEHNYDKGEEIGLTGEALNMFKFALYELECECDVNMETGNIKLLKVNGRKLEVNDGHL